MGLTRRPEADEARSTATMKSLIVFLSSVVAAAVAYPYPMPVAIAYPDQVPAYISAPKFDEPIARADHHGYEEHLGRVKMQIYRGPTTGKGYDYFAPWGYYNTQPADFHKKKYH